MNESAKVMQVKVNKSVHFIHSNDIVYIKSYGRYSKICTGKDSLISMHAIHDLEKEISSKRFLRVHRSYLVNISKIDRINDGKKIVVNTGEQIPLAKRRKTNIMSLITAWLDVRL